MKMLVSFAVLASAMISNQASACALCLDIFPEVIVMDQASTDSLISQNPKLLAGVAISEITCTKQNAINGNGSDPTCTIKSDVNLSLSGAEALSLYNRLGTLTVEVDGSPDDDWIRTGERKGPIALIMETETSSVRSIPLINVGKISCPNVGGKIRCEIELNVLHGILVSK